MQIRGKKCQKRGVSKNVAQRLRVKNHKHAKTHIVACQKRVKNVAKKQVNCDVIDTLFAQHREQCSASLAEVVQIFSFLMEFSWLDWTVVHFSYFYWS